MHILCCGAGEPGKPCQHGFNIFKYASHLPGLADGLSLSFLRRQKVSSFDTPFHDMRCIVSIVSI